MAQTSNICDVFEIYFDTDAGTGTYLLTNPGRSFKVLSARATGLNTAAVTCNKGAGGSAFVTATSLATGDLNDFPLTIVDAQASFTASDSIQIIVATAAVTRIIFTCAQTAGFSLTTTKTA